ncbi:MAG: hypothetical protein ACOCVM_03875 [Desulfovibrionaceae bacterium]
MRALGMNRIQTKIGLAIVAVSTVIYLLFAAYDFMRIRSQMLNELNAKADAVIERLSETLPPAVWNVDRQGVLRTKAGASAGARRSRPRAATSARWRSS